MTEIVTENPPVSPIMKTGRRKLWVTALFLGVGVGSVVGCSRTTPPPAVTPLVVEERPVAQPERAPIPLPTRGVVEIVGRHPGPTFAVEVAKTDLERNQGLMYRRVLGANKGMVFFMPGDRDWAFYMRNTRLPLDIIFVDATWQVVGVARNAAPMTETLRRVGVPSRYILELDAHEAKRHGIRAGTKLRFREIGGTQ